MFGWLKSCARRSRKSAVMSAVFAVVESMESRLLFDTCNITGNNITYTASTGADNISVTVNGSDVVIQNGSNSCSRPVAQTSSITINASDGSDTVDASGSPI